MGIGKVGQFTLIFILSYSVSAEVASADKLTRSQYATYWRDACVAKGRSKSISLTDWEILQNRKTSLAVHFGVPCCEAIDTG